MRKKQVTQILTVCSAAAVLMTGCGGSASTGNTGSNTKSASSVTGSVSGNAAEGEKTTLNFYYWDEGQKEGMDAMIALFEEEHSDITVESTIVPWSEYWTKLQTSIPNGTGPDVFWMNLYIQPYIEAGLIYDMTDDIKNDGVDLSVFPESVLQVYQTDGHTYGIPKDYDGISVFYNKEIFDEKNVDYPKEGWTWDDFEKSAKALTDDSHYGYAANPSAEIGYRSFMLSNGGAFTNKDYTEPLYNSAEDVEALQFLHDMMYVSKCSPTASDMIEMDPGDMFIGGQVGMISDGSWSLSKYADALGDQMGIMEMPGKVNNNTPTAGLALSISAKSSNTKAAMKFVEFAATKEAQDATVSAAIPANAESAGAWLAHYAEYPDAHYLIDSINESVSNPMYANGKTQEGEQIMSDAINNIWLDEHADIQSAMDKVVSDLKAVINEK
ncbi:MAG: sugar ABC transporter substrate-binding protein [Lachnospiraceae bacterium]|nr:sugar ABC transporter substrate-binding protein [Lachnospiraceae bacterium]